MNGVTELSMSYLDEASWEIQKAIITFCEYYPKCMGCPSKHNDICKLKGAKQGLLNTMGYILEHEEDEVR